MKARGEALSQSEIEALLASMPGEEGEAAPAPPQQNDKGLRTWDFRKPDKFSKDHLRSLLALHQTFSRAAATALSGRLRCSVNFRVTSVDQGLYEEYIDLLPEQSVVNVISMKPLDGNILLEFHAGLAMVMLDRLLGGSGGPVDANREMTDIELALVRNLVRTLLDALGEAWANLYEVDMAVADMATSPHLVQVASSSDIVVIVLLEVQIGSRSGTISLCIPHLVLEPLMQRLSAQVWVASNRRRTATAETRALVMDRLNAAPLRVTAVLGETGISVDELLSLRAGDVLLLGNASRMKASLRLVNQSRFVGEPGIVAGRKALRITDSIGDPDHPIAAA
jgi:flagellar motor switch protein FliM